MTLAHPDQPVAPHDVWGAWHADPLVAVGLLLAAAAYVVGRKRGRRRPGDPWRDRCFAAALVSLGVASMSPLDALGGALASAHMVQHLLLVVVAAPLLALSAPERTLLRGTPRAFRRWVGPWRGRLRRHTRALHHPASGWLVYTGTFWFWHAAVPYDAALEHDLVHLVEHAGFLVAALLFWGTVVVIGRTGDPSPGLGILLLFAAAMQGVFLSALLTFAPTPWYGGYARTTGAWGLDALADQQLAGVIMWVPGGLVYVGWALFLLARWLRESERADRRNRRAVTDVRWS